ncbi:hypothetical protein AB0B88_22360 [Micromonospora haikouensis]|uniref:immunity protein TriTu family protein n=1 Tax=Micromonospora TaxID=1873 RepID=UPI001E4350E5|nr:hypothetical protein [Micromonospora sp. NBRC 110038]
MSAELLKSFSYWVEEARPELVKEGFTVDVSVSPPGRPKPSIGVYLQLGERGSFLTLWESGECQLSTVDYASGSDPVESFCQVGSGDDLKRVLGLALSWSRGSPT